MDYEGFDRTVLVKFRSKLITAGLERVPFDNLMKLAVEARILSPENIQLADTSHILGALKHVDVKPANLEKYREGKAITLNYHEAKLQKAGPILFWL